MFRTSAEDVPRTMREAGGGSFVCASQYSLDHAHYAPRSLTVFDTLVASGREKTLLEMALHSADQATSEQKFSSASATLAYIPLDRVLHYARVSPHGQVVLYDYNRETKDLTGFRLTQEDMPVKNTHTLGDKDSGKKFAITDIGTLDLNPYLRENHDLFVEVSDGLNGTGGDPDKALLDRQDFIGRQLALDPRHNVNIAEDMVRYATRRPDVSAAVVQVAHITRGMQHPILMSVVRGRGTRGNEIADSAVQAIEYVVTEGARKSWDRSFSTPQKPQRT